MTKNLIIWRVNGNIWPTSPEVGLKLQLGMAQMTKEDLAKGVHKDIGIAVNGAMGYVISELPEKELYASLMRYQPYISFEIHPVLSIDDLINILQKAMKSLKK
jgi:hypothetical protein